MSISACSFRYFYLCTKYTCLLLPAPGFCCKYLMCCRLVDYNRMSPAHTDRAKKTRVSRQRADTVCENVHTTGHSIASMQRSQVMKVHQGVCPPGKHARGIPGGLSPWQTCTRYTRGSVPPGKHAQWVCQGCATGTDPRCTVKKPVPRGAPVFGCSMRLLETLRQSAACDRKICIPPVCDKRSIPYVTV